MLPLPGARAYQHGGHRCIRNEIVADFLANGLCFDVEVIYIAVIDGFVHNIVSHRSDEFFLVFLVVVVKTDEDLVPVSLTHRDPPRLD